jgi:hypothetical protein
MFLLSDVYTFLSAWRKHLWIVSSVSRFHALSTHRAASNSVTACVSTCFVPAHSVVGGICFEVALQASSYSFVHRLRHANSVCSVETPTQYSPSFQA